MNYLHFAAVILVMGSSSFANLLTTPTHTADSFGTKDVILECSSDKGQRSINWIFVPLGAASNIPIIVVNAGAVTANSSQVYTVVQSSPNSSDLMVNVLSNERMGTYTCSDSTVNASALLLTLPFTISTQPLFGPMVGGTNITFAGIDLYQLAIFTQASLLIFEIDKLEIVYFGKFIVSTNVWSSISADGSSASINVLTPAVNEHWIGQPLPIVFGFPDIPVNISFNRVFTYQGNPEITGIYPNEFLLSGGTRMSVYGTNLTSVSEPLISVTVIVSRADISSSSINTSTESCSSVNERLLFCTMPPVNVPADFLTILDGQYNQNSSSGNHQNNSSGNTGARLGVRSVDPMVQQHLLNRRRRSAASVLTVTGSNGIDRLDIYIGFTLDGYRKYENINNQLPDTRLKFYTPPEIVPRKDLLTFDSQKDKDLSIVGKYLTRGCRLDDYVVSVGSELCVNLDLTDNRLRCTPNRTEPPSKYTDSLYCDNSMEITVNLGNLRYHYGCLRYVGLQSTGSNQRNIPLIVGLSVGLPLFAILLALGIVLGVMYCKGKQKNSQQRTFYSANQNQQNQPSNLSSNLNSLPQNEEHSQDPKTNNGSNYWDLTETSPETANNGDESENVSEAETDA